MDMDPHVQSGTGEPPDPREKDLRVRALEAFQINDEDKLEISVERYGEDNNAVVAVDNFFRDPHATRDFASQLEYTVARAAFPGARATVRDLPLEHIVAFGAWCVTHHVLGLSGPPVPLEERRVNPEDRCFGVVTMGREEAASIPEEHPGHDLIQNGVAIPHVDFGWSNLLVHLSLPHVPAGGTALWQHKETGIQSWIMSRQALTCHQISQSMNNRVFAKMLAVAERSTAQTLDEFYEKLQRASKIEQEARFLAKSNKHWECVGYLPGKFNRLYVFPAWQFHSVVLDQEWPGPDFKDQRLTLNMFCNMHGAVP